MMHMNLTLIRSLAIWCANENEICDGLDFDFYMETFTYNRMCLGVMMFESRIQYTGLSCQVCYNLRAALRQLNTLVSPASLCEGCGL